MLSSALLGITRLISSFWGNLSIARPLWRQCVALLLVLSMVAAGGAPASATAFVTDRRGLIPVRPTSALIAPTTSSIPSAHRSSLPNVELPTLTHRESNPILLASIGRLPYSLHAVTSSGSATSAIASNFNGTAIAAGDYIWFNSVVSAAGISSYPTRLVMRGGRPSRTRRSH